MASLPKSLKAFAAGVAVASIPAYYQLHQDLFRTQRLVDDSVNRLRRTVVAQTQDLQKKVLELETQLAKQNGHTVAKPVVVEVDAVGPHAAQVEAEQTTSVAAEAEAPAADPKATAGPQVGGPDAKKTASPKAAIDGAEVITALEDKKIADPKATAGPQMGGADAKTVSLVA